MVKVAAFKVKFLSYLVIILFVLNSTILTVHADKYLTGENNPWIPFVGARQYPNINVIVHKSSSFPFWAESVSALKIAARNWVNGIDAFVQNYSQYSYLQKINFTFYIDGVNSSGVRHDIDIVFQIGICTYSLACTFNLPCAPEAVTKISDCSTSVLPSENNTLINMQSSNVYQQKSIFAHELGHALGLAHSSQEFDLMAPTYNGLEYPSSLDIYGLSQAYQWLQTGNFVQFYSNKTYLPTNISYVIILNGTQHVYAVTIWRVIVSTTTTIIDRKEQIKSLQDQLNMQEFITGIMGAIFLILAVILMLKKQSKKIRKELIEHQSK